MNEITRYISVLSIIFITFIIIISLNIYFKYLNYKLPKIIKLKEELEQELKNIEFLNEQKFINKNKNAQDYIEERISNYLKYHFYKDAEREYNKALDYKEW